ncbi:hypothetical protein Q7C18_02770 [Nesterenkonia sp. CL21]|uniref:hypothetical protein n=1 Tax=Nesterenkonia sp. CL21 TaxID=3064894 RepID=UPI00287B24EF|nr:hypothetical protein [Nesterenkonia sp. CL21]MDS2171612.1 hypothetical protein [Nesterenkonia sp. CL21]
MAGGPTVYWVDGLVGAVDYPRGGMGKGGVEDIVSHHLRVKSEVRKQAMLAGNKARGILAVHQANYPGTSTSIDVRGPAAGHKLDYSVHLVSNNGDVAATAIEYGHTGIGVDGPLAPFQVKGKRYPGLFILHRAFGLRR